ncbi:acyl-CoA dehydrogenase family protein [Actinomadura namibiensis]|uniref:acyl-CoA dehydrogenase family protein n=1 Tax=Actinomadura kijaniata TaxID=46161 RepID=UPI00362214D0
MAIGLTEEHEALAASVRGFAERRITPEVVRAALGSGERTPGFWDALAGQGLPGLHLPERHGGQGYGLLEQAVALEELGRALAPGPYLPTVLASAFLAGAGEPPASPTVPAPPPWRPAARRSRWRTGGCPAPSGRCWARSSPTCWSCRSRTGAGSPSTPPTSPSSPWNRST